MRSHQPLPMASHFHDGSFSACLSSFIPHHFPEWEATSDTPATVAFFQFFTHVLLMPNLGNFCSLFFLPGGLFSQFRWLTLILQANYSVAFSNVFPDHPPTVLSPIVPPNNVILFCFIFLSTYLCLSIYLFPVSHNKPTSTTTYCF